MHDPTYADWRTGVVKNSPSFVCQHQPSRSRISTVRREISRVFLFLFFYFLFNFFMGGTVTDSSRNTQGPSVKLITDNFFPIRNKYEFFFLITPSIARNGNSSAYILAGRFLTMFSLFRRPTTCLQCSVGALPSTLFLSLLENTFLFKLLQRRFVNKN